MTRNAHNIMANEKAFIQNNIFFKLYLKKKNTEKLWKYTKT